MLEQEVRNAIDIALNQIRQSPIPVGISNRHIHLSLEDFRTLFPGNDLTPFKSLHQPGHYAAEETLTVIGPKGSIQNVRVLGPLRQQTQVELSATDARSIGVKAPLRVSGQLEGSPGVKLVSNFGEMTLDCGAIVALRHIHMSTIDSLVYGLKDGDTVKVSIEGSMRKTTFDDVAIRVDPQQRLEMHIDTDEANAVDINNCDAFATIVCN
nr:propanediol utilization protein [Vibrio sp. 10N.286.48.B7]